MNPLSPVRNVDVSNRYESRYVDTPWFLRFVPALSVDAPRVICLPHAGSGASAFKNLTSKFFSNYEMLIIQYPGRETRRNDPFIRNLHQTVAHILDAIQPHLEQSYVLFGHSMGAKIGYELLELMKALQLPLPDHFVASCSPAPHRPFTLDPAYKGSDEEFLNYLLRLGGIPKELLEIDELVALILPILRADFELLDGYHPLDNIGPIGCPVTTIFSPDDASVTAVDTAMWEELSPVSFQHRGISGGHFYFSQCRETLFDILATRVGN